MEELQLSEVLMGFSMRCSRNEIPESLNNPDLRSEPYSVILGRSSLASRTSGKSLTNLRTVMAITTHNIAWN